jgi:hypothetical protein
MGGRDWIGTPRATASKAATIVPALEAAQIWTSDAVRERSGFRSSAPGDIGHSLSVDVCSPRWRRTVRREPEQRVRGVHSPPVAHWNRGWARSKEEPFGVAMHLLGVSMPYALTERVAGGSVLRPSFGSDGSQAVRLARWGAVECDRPRGATLDTGRTSPVRPMTAAAFQSGGRPAV